MSNIDHQELPSCSMDDVAELARQQLVFVVGSIVYRVPHEFLHPGGSAVLAKHTGQRIDHLFAAHDQSKHTHTSAGSHIHSRAALHLLQKFQYARLCNQLGGDDDHVDHRDALVHPPPAAASHAAPASILNPLQPLAWQVGRLGQQYSTWVHQPEPVAPPFFHSMFAECLSKTPWFLIPCIWIPMALLCLHTALHTHQYTTPHHHPECPTPPPPPSLTLYPPPPLSLTLLTCVLGMLLWQIMEYSIHRFVFHREPCGYWGVTLHFLLHGCHHKYPADRLRLVFPPALGCVVAVGVYCCMRLVLPQAYALAMLAGWILAYVAYDCFHYAMHHGGVDTISYMSRMRAKHMHHHYCQPTRGFGISSNTLDRLFRTMGDVGGGDNTTTMVVQG